MRVDSYLTPRVNTEYVRSSVLQVAKYLNDTENECILDLTNSGTLNALLNLPSCTQGVYLAYYTDEMDKTILHQIVNKKTLWDGFESQIVIVFALPFFWYFK